MTVMNWAKTRRGQLGSGVIVGTLAGTLAKKYGYTNSTKGAKKKKVVIKLKGGGSKKVVRSKPMIQRDGPVSKSFFHVRLKQGFKIPRNMKQLVATQFYLNNAIAKGQHPVNEQLITNVSQMYSGLDCANMYNAALSLITDSTRHANAKIYLQSCNQRTMITNQTNDVVRLAIYDIVPRKDVYNSTYVPPQAAWTVGLASAGATASSSTFVGATPFHSLVFTKLYKVQKVTNLELHSGGHHVHTVVAKPNRMIDGQYISEVGANANYGFANLTCYTMVVQHGFPVNDGTTKTNIGTAEGNVDFITTRQYKYRIYGSDVSDFRLATTALVNPGTEAIINDLTGATSTVATT